MKKIRLIPSNRAIGLFPKNPVTGEPALDMDPSQIPMPLSVGQSFRLEGQTFVITTLGKDQSNDVDYILVGVDLKY